MSNLDRIREDIIDEAKKEADKILEEARDKAEEGINRAREGAEKEAGDKIDAAKKDLVLLEENRRTGAELEARDLLIAAKEELIDRIFSLTKEGLAQMDDDKYEKILEEKIKENQLKKGTKIYIGEDRPYKNEDYQVLKSKDLESGFIFENEEVRINYDFSQLLEFKRDSLELEINRLLEEGVHEEG